MFYRFGCLLKNEYRTEMKWDGIFDYMMGDTLSLWRGLHSPKWYAKNPGKPSKAWFTEKGYKKWGATMGLCVSTLLEQYALDDFSIRLLAVPELGELGMKGKVQCIEVFNSWDAYFAPLAKKNIVNVWQSAKAAGEDAETFFDGSGCAVWCPAEVEAFMRRVA